MSDEALRKFQASDKSWNSARESVTFPAGANLKDINFSGKQHRVLGDVPQSVDSAATSRRQVPAAMKKIAWKSGTTNIDIGAGRFSDASEFLKTQGVRNLEFDPYNRSTDENYDAVLDLATSDGGADTATILNVLNVIPEAESRQNVIRRAAKAIKPSGRSIGSRIGAPGGQAGCNG